MPAPPPTFRPALLAPRHWPAWFGLALIRIANLLPLRAMFALGRGIGHLAPLALPVRRRVVARNLELCFPELDAAARARIAESTLHDTGLMLAEFALAWMGSRARLARLRVRFDDWDNLAAAHADGRGVLLFGGHFSHLELCARLVAERVPLAGMYREHDDAAFEWAIRRARLRYASAMFRRDEIRASVRHLRNGGLLWYAPDQDMRGKDIVFAPFFGVPAATITATHHLARMSGARVVPFFHRREPDGSYVIRIGKPLEGFPGPDPAADTARVNACIEAMVREAPAQYLWLHKRFKTRPPGQPSVYDAMPADA